MQSNCRYRWSCAFAPQYPTLVPYSSTLPWRTPSALQEQRKLGILQVLLAGNTQLEKTPRWLHWLLTAFSFLFFLVEFHKRPQWSVGHGKMLYQ
jgi:hypothetical protein